MVGVTAVERSLLLPEGTRLLHIGPHKTGTTSLQSAFHVQRNAVAAQGVHYTGPNRQPAVAVLAVTGRPSHSGNGTPPPFGRWRDVVREVNRAREPRLMISSEHFADAQPDVIRAIVDDLDPARVHVAVTLRPLARILPSQWQQSVQAGSTVAFDGWLEAMFNEPRVNVSPMFWHRHRHDQLIARWAEVVGPQNLTAVVVDDQDHAMVLRVFEQLLGLAEGTLVAERDLANRSMTLAEIEAVRAFNVAFRAERLGMPLHSKVMRRGAAQHMKLREPRADEPRIETPQWALERAGEIAREMVAHIAASGVRVVGDLESLTVVPTSTLAGDQQPDMHILPEIAASMAMGVLLSSGLARGPGRRLDEEGEVRNKAKGNAFGLRPSVEPPELARISTPRLASVLAGRLRTVAATRWHAVRGRIG